MGMFEKANPPAIPPAHRIASREAPEVDLHVCAGEELVEAGEAISLRAIEWSELTARLNAARDLRQLLQKDMNAKLGQEYGETDIDFADAAARFFRANEEDQRGVNHNALEPRKTSSGMYPIGTDGPNKELPNAEPIPTGLCEPGDARDK